MAFRYTRRHWMSVLVVMAIAMTTPTSDAYAQGEREVNPEREKALAVTVQGHAIHYVVYELRQRFGARICYETMAYNLGDPEDVISIGEVIRELEQKADTRQLGELESARLASARQMAEAGSDLSETFDIRFQRITGTFEAATIDELLARVFGDTSYEVYKTNNTYVIRPKEDSILEYPVTLSIESGTLGEVFETIGDQAPASANMGGIQIVGMGQLEALQLEVGKLELDETSAVDALSRAVEATGEDVAWALAGLENGRTLSAAPYSSSKGPDAVQQKIGANP